MLPEPEEADGTLPEPKEAYGTLPEPDEDGEEEAPEDDGGEENEGGEDTWEPQFGAYKKSGVDADELFFSDDRSDSSGFPYRTCLAALVVVLGAVAAFAWAMLSSPTPLECSAQTVRAQRFKIDVSDLWMPRIASTLQLGLSLRNANFFGSMLLEGCTVIVYEAASGLKLGTATHGQLMLPAMRTMQVNLAVKGVGESLPQPEQRRLAEIFLEHKALLLTIVATATSKLPLKGSKSNSDTRNSSRRLDLSTMAQDPFYERPPPPPPRHPRKTKCTMCQHEACLAAPHNPRSGVAHRHLRACGPSLLAPTAAPSWLQPLL